MSPTSHPSEGIRAVVLGCGYVGVPLAATLVEAGWEVTGTTTTPARLASIEETGATSVTARLDQPSELEAALAGATVVYLTFAARRGSDYGTVYGDGVKAVLAALDVEAARYVVFTSSTSVYGEDSGGLVDEETPPEPTTANAEALYRAERAFLEGAGERGIDALVFRLAGIWGPGRDPTTWMTRHGPVHPGDGSAYLNLVHLDDIVVALSQAALIRPTGVLNLANETPTPRRVFYSALAHSMGAAIPEFEEPLSSDDHVTGKRVDGRRATGVLGFSLRWPCHPGQG